MAQSIARHHAEWLSLLDISGPFLSISVLSDAYPSGLDAYKSNIGQELRAAYDEWADNQQGLNPDPAIHQAWIDYVLQTTLDMDERVLATGQSIPEILKFVSAEHRETVRPTMIIHQPNDPNQPRLLISTYRARQALDRQVKGSRWSASPAQRMQELCHATDIPMGLVTNGDQWMLVNARRGETTGFITWEADLWTQEKLTLQAFRTLLSKESFFNVPDERRLETLLVESADDQHEVTDQLGYQVRQAVEIIVQTIDRIDADRNRQLLQGVEEDVLYEAALTVMMRLVFLLSAEERALLPMDSQLYSENYAVSTLRGQLREMADQNGEEILERRHDAWSRLLATFRAVHGGVRHENLLLPAYGGSLFDPDKYAFLEGRPTGSHWGDVLADPLPIDNRTVLHLLEALQLLRVNMGGAYETRRISFRALDIEQIGHVYEGLLDHKAARADEVMLGLVGTKNQEPEVPLNTLMDYALRDTDGSYSELIDYIKDQTGRSVSAIRNALLDDEIDGRAADRLFTACNGDPDLYETVKNFAHLIRADDYGNPFVIHEGGVYITAGTTRRATGTHYTPKSLTEPIVQHTLEPLVYIGPAEGHERENWQLKSSRELLDLKICDMAMGSGAFLVQTVRYMSERLVEAWNTLLAEHPDIPRLTVEGKPPTGAPNETHIPDDPDERLILARRLVADRCIYGVDKNPLAVEMAKLSLWLITLEKNRAFTFLDHALKAGDSLVGVDLNQLRYWDLHPDQKAGEAFIGNFLNPIIERAIDLRQRLASFTVRDIRDQQEKQRLYDEAEATTAVLKTAGDHLIADSMGVAGSSIVYELSEIFKKLEDAGDEWLTVLQQNPLRPADELDLTPFHWHLEYPEVFQRGGFSAFVGNPPFIGGQKISGNFGDHYREFLVEHIAGGQRGSADICAYFFLRASQNTSSRGYWGLIATRTISEGDTRDIGLESLKSKGISIIRATSLLSWPGSASVIVSVLQMTKASWKGKVYLDNKIAENISTFLADEIDIGEPYQLAERDNQIFQGSSVVGGGFIIDEEEAHQLISHNTQNNDVVRPYITGKSFCTNPKLGYTGWIINFFDRTEEQAKKYNSCYSILEERVKPYRMTVKRKTYRKYWWQFGEKRPTLYRTIEGMEMVLANARVAKYIMFDFLPTTYVFLNTLHILPFDDLANFAILQSDIHSIWAQKRSSSTGATTQYTPPACFGTFPFPHTPNFSKLLNSVGENYHRARKAIIENYKLSLTDTYNRFHDPDEDAEDIEELRRLHVEMDIAVASAYRWDDIDLGHDFHETAQGIRFTISESARREVLTRLLKLNHERFAQECHDGLHTTKTQKRKCKEFFQEHPEYKKQSSASTGTIGKSGNEKSGKMGIRPFGEDDDDNPKQKRMF